MKITIEGSEEQIKKVLQAICGSKEHENTGTIFYGPKKPEKMGPNDRWVKA